MDDRHEDPGLRRRNRRLALLLGILAVAVYVAFFVLKGLEGG